MSTMKKHTMKLKPAPFEKIRTGKKIIELRLYDEKRKQISVGDSIQFVNTDNATEMIDTTVEDLFVFDSFEELYKNLPLLECGYSVEELPTASPRDMELYYPREEQRQYGVIGIKISLQKSR